MTNEEIYKKNQKVDFRGEEPLIGRAHTGRFSTNNPYLENLQKAWNLRDESAIYEMAVKWEAEYADTLEAREYSDPINEVARQRRAGINPDIAGGSASGSAIGSVASAIDTPTQNTTPFGSPSESTSMLINGFATAGQIVSALSSFGATAINGMATLAMLPIQQRAGELSNQLAFDLMPHQVANAENIATAGQLANKSAQLANKSAQLGLINQTLGTLSSFSSFITPDMTDEQSSSILSSFGVPADQIPTFQQGIKQWHSNPLYKATWEQNLAKQREAEVYNEVFTREYQKGLLDMVAQIQTVESSLEFVHKDFELKVANFLNTDEYAEDVGTNAMASTNLSTKEIGLQSEQVDFNRNQLKRDMEAYEKELDYLAEATRLSQSTIDRIRHVASNEGRSLSAAEEALIKVEQQKIIHYTTLGSKSLSRAKDFVIHTIQNNYFHRALIDRSTGMQIPTWFNPNYEKFMSGRLNFNGLVDGSVTSSEVTSSFVNTLIDFGVGLATRKPAPTYNIFAN